jgi:hypothetical protein
VTLAETEGQAPRVAGIAQKLPPPRIQSSKRSAKSSEAMSNHGGSTTEHSSSENGPPASPDPWTRIEYDETFEAEAVDPIIDDDLYVFDPVPPDDDAPT